MAECQVEAVIYDLGYDMGFVQGEEEEQLINVNHTAPWGVWERKLETFGPSEFASGSFWLQIIQFQCSVSLLLRM